MKLLIVDDNPDVRMGFKMFFEGLEGAEIHEAVNGKAALEKLRAGLAPEVILSDVDMPVMGGLDLARFCQQEYPGTPFILCSGENYEKEAKTLGVAFFQKGLDLRKLMTMVLAAKNSVH